MREYFTISAATPQSAFLKANHPLCGKWPVEIKESPLWKFKSWLWGLEDDDEAVAKKPFWTVNSGVAPDDDGPLDGGETQGSLEDIESWPPNRFGRGQAVSSFQCSPVSTGFRPKPITQWRLLGGAGGNPRKKVGPGTKAQGNYFTKFFHLTIFFS